MKRLIAILTICGLLFGSIALAEDMVLTAKIASVTEAVDKNGNDYVRFIINEARTMNGINYNVGVPVMAFGPTVEQAKTYKEGDVLKAIVKKREWQSRESYTILAYMP